MSGDYDIATMPTNSNV